ncbi:mechanosensitive ion channel family protein [Paenibacillus athensensis]|uniref:Mechanosensitive ion channel protein MscS n=2 Tax=Paenibacillus athensensis TaxID=1967502 RepID=A0A4Y8PVE7_9BACL|nr:mechanosensitive ion channel family protein [Paenibacillus athensensis]
MLIKIANKAISHMMTARKRAPLKFDQRRANTIGKLVHNLISYTVNFISILLILGQLGINLGPLLAGAGVLGLAIGFGAQSLVKDVITGFFIIFEDQFGVGDVIQIDQFKGTVEEIGIRVTRIKSWTGEVHIIPNGNIKQVTNFSLYNSLAVVDVSIAYDADVDAAVKVLKETVGELYQSSEKIVKEPEVLGVQAFGNSELRLRITAECLPNAQGEIGRLMNAEIKKKLDEHGIEMAYPKTITYMRTEKAAE